MAKAKKYSLKMLNISKESSRVNDAPATWDYIVTNPEMTTKRDVYEILNQLDKVYGRPVDSVGVYRRYFDSKTSQAFLFSIIEDSTGCEFSYSQKDQLKYFPE